MIRILLAILAFVAVPAAAAPVRISSPDEVLTVTVDVNGEGRPEYSVSRLGRPVILPSRLGFILTDAPKLERNFEIASSQRRSADETWEQPWGERRFVRNRYNELRVRLTEKAPKRSLDVVFRVYDDGIGFRYEFPDQAALKDVNIGEEITEFALADPATAWWIPAFQWNREEYLYNRTKISEVGIAQTPMTVRTDGGLHVAFHEAALVDYSGMNLQNEGHGRFRAILTPSSDGAKVKRTAPFPTPWRTMQIADSAGGLVTNNLILNLNEPSKLPDIRSWFRPFKYVGVWWAMHLDKESWGPGPKHGANTANVKRYIDFAARHGFRGILVEGWNKGWNDDWFANGRDFSFTEPYPDFDIEELARYARVKGVHLIGHHETAGNIAVYEPQIEAAFDLYRRLGIDAVKTGYVADMGGIQAPGPDGKVRFEWHEGQVMARHHLKVVQEAAERHIGINPHEPIKDTGLRRTWPNWVAREGARGMEFNAWGQPPNPPEHESNLVFTRMLAGPMDFTPGILSLEGRGQPILSTQAKQLALYVVIYSPIVMAADLIENYEKEMRPFQFIKDVPADWAESLVLNGEIGDFVTIARKDRNSESWYLGSVTDENGRELKVPLSFLTPGKPYRAQIYRDGPNADYRGRGKEIVIEERTVTSADVLTLRLAPGGGQAIRFISAKRRR
jgi:alpha-glucosidase